MDEHKRSAEQVERWLGRARPAWREGYDFLMATQPGIRYYDALLAVWLSVSKRDRGKLKTQEDFADFIGVSRPVTYQWIKRRPEILKWAQKMVELRFSATRLADVDERLYQKAAGLKSTPAWVKLYYQRAGVLKDEGRLTISGDEDEPLGIKVVGDYRVAIAGLAPRSVGDRQSPSADQGAGDGAPVG